MDNGISISPNLPRPNPTASYWQNPPDSIANLQSSPQIPTYADVVVVGSGISGSSIAYNLLEKQPDLSVVLLEARQAASGASGRNGGHTKGASYRSFLDNVSRIGETEALKIAHLEYNCMIAVHAFAQTHGIDCDSRRLDTVDVFYDEGQWHKAQESVTLMQKLMQPLDPAAKYDFWDPDQTASKFLTPNAIGSITYPAGSLSAYRFVMGVLKLALSRGLHVQCNTPVISISKTTGPDKTRRGRWLLETPCGTLSAETVVLATNGYTAHLYPPLQGVVVPLRGHLTAQRPGINMPKEVLSNTYSFIYTHGYEYMIQQPLGSQFAGDIVIGGGLTKTADHGLGEYGNTDDSVLNEEITQYLSSTTETFFRENWGTDDQQGRIRTSWSGIMGFSGDGFPIVGPIRGEAGLYISASFQGHGMVLCFLCAKALTHMLLDEDDDELAYWFPTAYRMSEARLHARFKDMLHEPNPVDPAPRSRKQA